MQGLIYFAQTLKPGSIRELASLGDERNALLMLGGDTTGQPFGEMTWTGARLYQFDDEGKINTEHIVFCVEPAVDPSRFQGPDDAHPGGWMSKPDHDALPEQRLLSHELDEQIHTALAQLPPAQTEVVRLRDVQDLSSDEVCSPFNLSEVNQRVLLHRGRSKLRGALEAYMAARSAPVEETR
jgi:RNA polymerase sigma factor (sigma-70 family)